METSSSCSWVKQNYHGPQCTGVRVRHRGYGFIEFEISNSTISIVFRQPSGVHKGGSRPKGFRPPFTKCALQHVLRPQFYNEGQAPPLARPPFTVSFHNFKSQNFKLSVSNPKNKYVVYLSVLSQISNCQSLGRKNKQ